MIEDQARRWRTDRALLKWLKRQANGDLRAARAAGDTDGIDRQKALLDLLRWADRWMDVRDKDYPGRPDVDAALRQDADMIMYGIRRLAYGYRHREGWRPAWSGPGID